MRTAATAPTISTNQNQRSRPGLLVPIVIRRDSVSVNLQRQRRGWLVQFQVPKLISESREQQRGSFPSHAGKGQHAAGDDARRSGTQRNGKRGPPPRDAEPVGRFANHVRHHQQHFFGGARHRGNHHDAQRHAAGERREMFLPDYDQRIDGNADHDGGHAVQHVGGEANHVAEAIAPVLRQIDAGANAQGNADHAGHRENQSSAHDAIRHSSAHFTRRLWRLREEGPVDRADALDDQVSENGKQRNQHQNGSQDGEAGRSPVREPAPKTDFLRGGCCQRARHVASQFRRLCSTPANAPAH